MDEVVSPSPERLKAAGILVAGLLIAVLISLLLPARFWVLDESFRYLQMTSMEHELTLPPPLRFPGTEQLLMERPDLAPVPFHYGFIQDGRIYSQYSPILALLSLPTAGAVHGGVYLVPAAGFAVFWMLLFLALRRNGMGTLTAVLLPLLGTPVLFYGSTFWSHAPAAALIAGAVLSTLNSRKVWIPFALVTAAVLLREEALPMFAIPLLLGKTSLRNRFILLLASAGVILLCTKGLTGEWMGTHVQASGSEQELYGHSHMGFFRARMYVVFMSLLTFFPGAPIWMNAVGGLLLFALWAVVIRGPHRFSDVSLYAGLLIGTAALAAAVFRDFRLMDSLYALKNPLVICPALWLVRPGGRLPYVLLGVLLLMEAAMGPMHVEDLAWGSRLTMLPVLSMLILVKPAPARRMVPVVLAGLMACAVSVGFLASRRRVSDELVTRAMTVGDAVVITNWMLTGEFAREVADGVPVIFTSTAEGFSSAVSFLEGWSPVVISRVEDVPLQTDVFRSTGFPARLSYAVEFDPSLRVAILSSGESE